MGNILHDTHWLSINLDDTVSMLKDSFEEACCNKSLYIAKQTYHSESVSGKTKYYRYKFYTPVGESAYPNVGNCEVSTDITQSYNGYNYLNELLRYRKKDILYPISMSGFKGTCNICNVSDNKSELRIVYLSSLSDLFPFLRELSRTSCWEEFKFQQVLKAIKDSAESIKTSITKYGYSRREYAYQYGAVPDDPTFRERYFNYDLQKLQEAFDLILVESASMYIEDEKYAIEYLQGDINFIEKVLNGEKPWRK